MFAVMVLVVLTRILVVTATVSFFPNTSVVTICDENTLTLTCVTDTGLLIWATPFGGKSFFPASQINVQTPLGDNITVQLTHVSGAILTSGANIAGPPDTLNGIVITCRDGLPGTDVKSKTLLKPGTTLPPDDFKFTALNFTSAKLKWKPPGDSSSCIHRYTVQIQSNTNVTTLNSSVTVNITTINVTGLTRGVEYTVTVFGIYSDGITGKHGMIQMTLDVGEPVENLSTTFIRTPQGGVILYATWNMNPLSSRPPVTHYIVTHNVSDISNQLYTSYTNITIHGALPGHVYYMQVTPVNVLGPGAARATYVHVTMESTSEAPATITVTKTALCTQDFSPALVTVTPSCPRQGVQSWVLVTLVFPWLLLLALGVATGICCCYAMKKGLYLSHKKRRLSSYADYKVSPIPSVYEELTRPYFGHSQPPASSTTKEKKVTEESNKEKTNTGVYDVPIVSENVNLRMSQNISYTTTAAIEQEAKFD